MVDQAVQAGQAVQALQPLQQVGGTSLVNWTLNVYDLIMTGVGGVLLYARLVKIETQLSPIVDWWNQRQIDRVGRRWTDGQDRRGEREGH